MVYKGDNPDDHQVIIDLNKDAILQRDPENVNRAKNEIKRLRVPRKPKWDGIRSAVEQSQAEGVRTG